MHLPVVIFMVGTVLLYTLEPYLKAQELPIYRTEHAKTNIKISFLNLVILAASGIIVSNVAIWTESTHFGARFILTNYVPNTAMFCLNILAYDFVNYWIHRSQHEVTRLWPLHRIHHTDPYLDVTSAFRFHPFETLYRVTIQALAVFLLGITVAEISTYLSVVVCALLFSHTNIKLRRPIDRFIGYFFVTPDIHRVHHAWERRLHDSNYGIVFSFWDRVFGSFSDPDHANQFNIGLKEYPRASSMTVKDILRDPISKN